MSQNLEVHMKEVELTDLDQEKVPMTGDPPGSDKNGSVVFKVPEEEVKFTGLSKEELMIVAGTPGWVRTRWVLLVLFWLGWLGMLAGAIWLIVQAPRCKAIPEMNWWNEGPLYRVSDLDAFTGDKGLQGVSDHLDSVGQMKVKALVLGPLHTVQADQEETLDLTSIDPTQGTEQQLLSLLDKAHKKGLSVVLDLTPNYLGDQVWFEPDSQDDVLNKLKSASEHWLRMGVDGIQLSDFSIATVTSPEWAGLKAVVQGNRTEGVKNKALIGRAGVMDATAVSQLLNSSGADLLLSDMMSTPGEPIRSIQKLLGDHKQSSLAWGLGAGQGKHLGLPGSGLPGSGLPGSVQLNHLLLLTMPGTPAFMYGDEIGLTEKTMVWDSEETPVEGTAVNKTVEDQRSQRQAYRLWFRSLSDLRGKERSLLHGDFLLLHSSPTSLAFLRSWDQSERYVTAINWGSQPATLALSHAQEAGLPTAARVRLSSDPEGVAPDASVPLDQVVVGAGQGLLLSYPFQG